MAEPQPLPRVPIGDDGYTISALVVGGWQLSRGHRATQVDEGALFADLERMVRAGWTSFDCADIYTGVEQLLGRFRASRGADLARDGIELQLHTKFVPDQEALARLTRAKVEAVIDRSLARLGVERLDLVQFAWWDYSVAGYVEVAGWLDELRARGKIRHLGATNFDTGHMAEMLDAGVPLVTHQVQYSLLDRRPEHGARPGMLDLARERGFQLLCYGALAGGLLSARYLGAPAPAEPLANRSLVKYRLVVDEAGGWGQLQQLLRALDSVAQRHGVTPSAVALRWLLERPAVAAAMVGTFHAEHAADNRAAFGLSLGAEDRAVLDAATARLTPLPGDVWDLERAPGGPHARIMWKNLSREGE